MTKSKDYTLPQVTYDQIRDYLSQSNNRQIKSYISENLALLVGAPFKMLSHFSRAPFRFNEMRLLLAEKGEAVPIVNLRRHPVREGDLIFASGGSVAQLESVRSDIRGRGISCTNELTALAFGGALPTILKRPQLVFVLHLEDEERHFFKSLFALLWRAVHEEDMSSQVVLSLVSAFIGYADQLYLARQEQHVSAQSHEQQIFDRFLSLVNHYGTRQHQIGFYADRLALSQRYFGTLIKQVSGVSAKEWIDREIITSIKVELRHTDKSVKEIVSEMNFPNESFFCKYFKRLTGQTPKEYRQG